MSARRPSASLPRLVLAVAASLVAALLLVNALRGLGGGSSRSGRFHMRLVDTGEGNEVLLMEARMPDGNWHVFQLDSAYAGPPVLSLSYLHTIHSSPPMRRLRIRKAAGSAKELLRAYSEISSAPSCGKAEMWQAVSRFLDVNQGCRSFTSGCSVRLMGIGETSEVQSSMFVCPPLSFDRRLEAGKASGGWDADVLVTHPLPGAPHILTIDYLLHRAPCVLELSKGLLRTRSPLSVWERSSFVTIPSLLVGGAFVVQASVGGGSMRLIVDTGSSGTISIGRPSAAKILACAGTGANGADEVKTVTQRGIHGETVCSDVLSVDVVLGGAALPAVEVMVNSSEVEAADGYLGLALLRAFDVYVDHGEIAFRKNGLPVARVASAARSARCSSTSPLPPCATSGGGRDGR